MRGPVIRQTAMLSAVTTEDLVPKDHPIRRIKPIVDAILVDLEPTFRQMYSGIGRPSIPPEHLLKSTVLMAMYSVRSERQFCERLQYDMLFRWFLDMGIEDSVFVPTSFTKNRERLLTHEVADKFFKASVEQARLATSRTSISPPTAACSRHGPRSRASSPAPRAARGRPTAVGAPGVIPRWTSTVRSAATLPISPPRIPRPC